MPGFFCLVAADNRIPVGETLASAGGTEVPADVGVVHPAGDRVPDVEVHGLVAVRETDGGKRPVRVFSPTQLVEISPDRTHHSAVGTILLDGEPQQVRNKVVFVCDLKRHARLHVVVVGVREQRDADAHLTLGRHFDESRLRSTLHDERVTVVDSDRTANLPILR